ncbi:hypothetical protein JZ751_022114 [Albula glossodonta]|uniref:Uncharacterized protein n=1 Tax=Albula glossodonta TaxID=121402 RepID=A0A8T2NJ17_9TELE|nr:hypothetical protein JZ751_022114 [Albula glossodonta]
MNHLKFDVYRLLGHPLPAVSELLHLPVVALLLAQALQPAQCLPQLLPAVPQVVVLRHTAHQHQRLQHVHDVVDPPPFHACTRSGEISEKHLEEKDNSCATAGITVMNHQNIIVSITAH